MTREELYEKARLLPATPGVYLMHSKTGRIIYVGKSRALRNRVSSYFAPFAHHKGKTKRMVESVDDFEVYYVDTELEALIQENQFIKQYQPRFNIKLKDGGGYPYIRISDAPYPEISIVWKRSGSGRYFGPYSSAAVAKQIVFTASATFGFPSCGKTFPRDIGKGRPCLNYQIGRCMGVCRKGGVSEKEYAEAVDAAVHFLNGNYRSLAAELQEKMEKASESLNFELAARYRDMIKAITKLGDKQQVIANTYIDCDIIGFYADDIGGEMLILFVRNGAIFDREIFEYGNDEITDEADLTGFLQRYYAVRGFVPQKVCLSFEPDEGDRQLLQSVLTSICGKNVTVMNPKRGILKSLTDKAVENARDLMLHRRKVEEKQNNTLIALAEFLHLECVPDRIESYDVSNSGDEIASCGMIVLEKGRFAKRMYRSFNIENHTDDLSSLKNALGRRFDHGDDENGWHYPDLILMDGGMLQVAAAKEVLLERNIDIPVFGMIKDENHKTRTLTDGVGEIGLTRRQDLFVFLYKIQEEVHRYALERMDKRRRQTVKHSSLTQIKGIGEAKAKLLLETFGTLKALSEASESQLAAVKGINAETAKEIYLHFHKGE